MIQDDISAFKTTPERTMWKIIMLPEFWAVLNYRIRHWIYKSKIPILSSLIKSLYWFIDIVITTITNVQISPNAIIGKGLYIPHRGTTVINGSARIGDYCTIFHGVTIGRGGGRDIYLNSATIGNNVYIGAGAAIIGEIKIGNYVTIGANAVITKDVPDYALVVGNPAKIYRPPSEWNNNSKSSFFLLEWRNPCKRRISLFFKEAKIIFINLSAASPVNLFVNSIFLAKLNTVDKIFLPPEIDVLKPLNIELISNSNFEVYEIKLE